MNKEIEDKIKNISGSYRGEKIVAVDFDDTLFRRGSNGYPEIGAPIEKTINYVKELQASGWKTILWTCRSGEELKSAIEACVEHDLFFDRFNDNLHIEDNQLLSRKIYASLYIDDKSINPMEF